MKQAFQKLFKRTKGGIFLKKLTLFLAPGAKVFDIGCGDGSFLKEAHDSGFECAGIEISKYLSDIAKDKKLRVFEGDFLSSDFTEEKFDGITLISLIEHLNDPELAVKKCFDLLSDRGVLFLKTVNYGCLNRVIRGAKWTGFRPPDHMVYFTPSNLTRLLKKIGFKKVRSSALPFNDNMYLDAWK